MFGRIKLKVLFSHVTEGKLLYYVCDVTLSVYPHRACLKNMPGHGGNRTYDIDIEGTRLSSEISHTRTDLIRALG